MDNRDSAIPQFEATAGPGGEFFNFKTTFDNGITVSIVWNPQLPEGNSLAIWRVGDAEELTPKWLRKRQNTLCGATPSDLARAMEWARKQE